MIQSNVGTPTILRVGNICVDLWNAKRGSQYLLKNELSVY